MWGLEFIDAYNNLMAAGAEFIVRDWPHNNPDKRYLFKAGIFLQEWNETSSKYTTIAKKEEVEKAIVTVLGQRYGFNWDYRSFLIALTFWSEGHRG